MKLTEIGMFMTCLNMLSAMLSDNVEIGGTNTLTTLDCFTGCSISQNSASVIFEGQLNPASVYSI